MTQNNYIYIIKELSHWYRRILPHVGISKKACKLASFDIPSRDNIPQYQCNNVLILCSSNITQLLIMRTAKAKIRLRECSGWSGLCCPHMPYKYKRYPGNATVTKQNSPVSLKGEIRTTQTPHVNPQTHEQRIPTKEPLWTTFSHGMAHIIQLACFIFQTSPLS